MEKDPSSSKELQNAIIEHDVCKVISFIQFNSDETNDQLWEYVHFNFSQTSEEDEKRFRDAVENQTINPNTPYWDFVNNQNKKLFMAAVQSDTFNPASQAFWDFLNAQLTNKNIANLLTCTAFFEKPHEMQSCIEGYKDPEMNGIPTTPPPTQNKKSFKINEDIKKWTDQLFTFWSYKHSTIPLNHPLFIDFFKGSTPRKKSITKLSLHETVSFDSIQIPFHEFLKSSSKAVSEENQFVQLVLQPNLHEEIVHYIGDRIINSYTTLFQNNDAVSYTLLIQFLEILKNQEDSHPLKMYINKNNQDIFLTHDITSHKTFYEVPNPDRNPDGSLYARLGCNLFSQEEGNERLYLDATRDTPLKDSKPEETTDDVLTQEQLRLLLIMALALSSLLLLLPSPYYICSFFFMVPAIVLLFENEKNIPQYTL